MREPFVLLLLMLAPSPGLALSILGQAWSWPALLAAWAPWPLPAFLPPPRPQRGSCGARLTETVSYFESPAVPEAECEATVAIRDGICHLRLRYEAVSLGLGCLRVGKAAGREAGRVCGEPGAGLESLVPVGRHEEVALRADQGSWRVRVEQEACRAAAGRAGLALGPAAASCGAQHPRGRRAAAWAQPRVASMLEIAHSRVKEQVASEFFQVVTASTLELSKLATLGSPRVASSQGGGVGARQRRRQQRRRRRKKSGASLFPPVPRPAWLGRVTRPGGDPCPAYLVSPGTALSPAPCLLAGPTAPARLTLALGPHARAVTSLLLHPTRAGHDLALLELAAPLPASLGPACLSPITSKYSSLLVPPESSLALRTVNRRKCGKLGRDQVCVALEAGAGSRGPLPGDPVVRNGALEGFYLRRAAPGYHVVTDLFQLKLWLAAANSTNNVP